MTKIKFLFAILSCILIGFSMSEPVISDDSNTSLTDGIDLFHKAYNKWDKDSFERCLVLFEQVSHAGREDGLAEYWSGATYFFLSLHNLFSVNKTPDKARGIENAEKGIEVLTKSIELSSDFSESYALRGVLRGILIKMKPFSAFTQGRKVGKDREKALELDSLNPRVHYLTGVSFRFAPEILGGSERALEHLLKAEELFEKERHVQKDSMMPSWGESACLAFIGDIYASKDEDAKAFTYYNKALEVNPDDPLALKGMTKIK